MANFLEIIGLGKGANAAPRAFLIGGSFLIAGVSFGLWQGERKKSDKLEAELLACEKDKTAMERAFRVEAIAIQKETAELARLSQLAKDQAAATATEVKKLKK